MFKKNKRKISYEYYIISLNVVIIILLISAFAYVILDNKRILSQQDNTEIQNTNYISLQLQYALIDNLIQNDNVSCSALNSALENSISDLGASLDKILRYKKESMNEEYYETLNRKYILDNIKYWMFAKKANEICDLEKINVLYFYSDACEICPNQGVILSYYKKKYNENILVFPINADDAKDEPVIKLLLSSYQINQYPSLIINNHKYEGIKYKEDLGNILSRIFIEMNSQDNYTNQE